MDDLRKGIILKSISGFYYVEAGGKTVECRARGRFRAEKTSPLTGDRVIFRLSGDKGTIIEILPRKNHFSRPAVANIDLLIIVASAALPVTVPFLIDRMIVSAETAGCEPVVCVNKTDIEDGGKLRSIYSDAGYTALCTSASTGEGIEELISLTKGRVCAFTGNSGVGKSSILNAIEPDFGLITGTVSERLGRGRHTTRHVELYKLGNGALAADTPGFSSFDGEDGRLPDAGKLQYAFRDFSPYTGKCRYSDCVHVNEPGCAVRRAVEEGAVHESRYESYRRLYELAKQKREELY